MSMSMISDQQIETLLRLSPGPRPPADLKAGLIRQAQTRFGRASRTAVVARPNWFQQWWRLAAPAGFMLVCLFVLGIQQKEIRNRKENIQTLKNAIETGAPVVAAVSTNENASTVPSPAEAAEIERLKETVNRLSAQIAKLEQLRVENQNLRTQLSAPPSTSGEDRALEEELWAARLRAECVNNMKQVGLAAILWASDHSDIFPPDIVSMTNEIVSPSVLWCPADPGHSMVKSWSAFTEANCSYEYLAPSGRFDDPTRVIFRCPIHGNITLCDGSVQAEVAKKHPEQLETRDGKLYYRFGP